MICEVTGYDVPQPVGTPQERLIRWLALTHPEAAAELALGLKALDFEIVERARK